MEYEEFEQEFLRIFDVKKENLRTQKDFNNMKLKIALFKVLKRAEFATIAKDDDDRRFMFFGLFSLVIMLLSMFDNMFEEIQNNSKKSPSLI